MFEIGRICVKTAGREAGRFCTVVGREKEKDKQTEFVIVTGPKSITRVKRRKCNIHHLEPTPFKIDIKENATDEEVTSAYEKFEVYKNLNIPKPGEERKVREKPREETERQERKEEQKEERKKEEKEAKHEEKKHEEKEAKPKKTRAKKAKPKKAKE